jgi:VanZ family protein
MSISRLGKCLRSWLPVILWASVIFVFSTDVFSSANTVGAFEPILHQLFPGFTGDDIERIHLAVRKLGHFSEYFVFGGLLWRALRHPDDCGKAFYRLALSIVITMIYAVGDELHQSFVPSRTASSIDVLIDTIGGICGALVFYFHKPAIQAQEQSLRSLSQKKT